MSHFYTVYGLNIKSDQPLESLIELSISPHQVDLSISFVQDLPLHLREVEWVSRFAPNEQQNNKRSYVQALTTPDRAYLQLHYIDDVRFFIDVGAKQLWIISPPHFSHAYIVSYVTNAILGLYIRLHNQVCLHASGVVVDNRAILFCAPSGFGKSTTALAFALQGHPVLADDICVINPQANEIWVKPGYPHLRLWKYLPVMGGKAIAVQSIAPDWQKKYIDLQRDESFSFSNKSYPIDAIYMIFGLDETLQINALQPGVALIRLMQNVYMNWMSSPQMRAADLRVLSQLVETIPVRSFVRTNGLQRLDELYQQLMDDYTGLCHARESHDKCII